MSQNMKKFLRLLYIASIVLYAISLALPALGDKDLSFYGVVLFIWGWYPGADAAGCAGDELFAFWLANPLYLIGALLFGFGAFRMALVFAGVVLLLGLGFYAHITSNSGGFHCLVGAYAWLASFIVLFLAAATASFRPRQP